MYYKLDENKKVIPSSIEEWSNFIEGKFPTNYRHVGDEIINGIRISTVFIGLCVDFNNETRLPNVFETMIFDKNDRGIYQRRYTTWEDAELGHQRALQWLKERCKNDE
jgi:hypothetical protein